MYLNKVLMIYPHWYFSLEILVFPELSTVRWHCTALSSRIISKFHKTPAPCQVTLTPWHLLHSGSRLSQSEASIRARDQSEARRVSPVVPCQQTMTLGLLHTLDIHWLSQQSTSALLQFLSLENCANIWFCFQGWRFEQRCSGVICALTAGHKTHG